MSEELDFRTMPKWLPEAISIMAMVETWAKGYGVPRDAIIRQIPYAYAWCQSNPKKAPKKNILRFLFSWMKQAKRWGNLKVPDPKTKPKAQTDPEPDMSYEDMVAIRRRNFPQRGTLAEKHKDAFDSEAVA